MMMMMEMGANTVTFSLCAWHCSTYFTIINLCKVMLCMQNVGVFPNQMYTPHQIRTFSVPYL